MPQFSISTDVRASPATVWEAITNPDLVQKYFFGTRLSTDWRVGSELTFRGEYEGQAYEDRGTVLAFEPERSLTFDYWSSFSGTEDVKERRQIVRYDVEPEGPGARVTVQQSNIDTEERAAHSAKNWQLVLDGLKKLVEAG